MRTRSSATTTGRTEPTGDVLAAHALRVQLGSATILRGVDLAVSPGEVVALLGANGSGKSTLMRALLGLVPISDGDAHVLGTSVRTQRTRVAWERVGYVPQRVTATSGMPATALEVVLSGMLHRHRFHPGRGGRARALEALDSVGLGDRSRAGLHELSGGQQQRVLIARALARRPDVLLLDEPVSGVDRPSQETFARLLADLHARGVTVLIVLHELGLIEPIIDRAVVLRHGRVVHDGALPAPAPGHEGEDHDHVHAEHGEHPETTIQRSLP